MNIEVIDPVTGASGSIETVIDRLRASKLEHEKANQELVACGERWAATEASYPQLMKVMDLWHQVQTAKTGLEARELISSNCPRLSPEYQLAHRYLAFLGYRLQNASAIQWRLFKSNEVSAGDIAKWMYGVAVLWAEVEDRV